MVAIPCVLRFSVALTNQFMPHSTVNTSIFFVSPVRDHVYFVVPFYRIGLCDLRTATFFKSLS